MPRKKQKAGGEPASDQVTEPPASADASKADAAVEDEAATAATELAGDASEPAPSEDPVSEDAEPETPADPSEPQTAADAALTQPQASDPVGDAETYPCQVRVTNNTRMPIQIPAVKLGIGPAPASAVIVLNTAADRAALVSDLETLRTLNGFADDAFQVTAETEVTE